MNRYLGIFLILFLFTSSRSPHENFRRVETILAFESFEGTAGELGYTSNDWIRGFSDYSSRVSDQNAGSGVGVTYHIASGVPSNLHDDGTGDTFFYAVDDLDDSGNIRSDDLSVITFNNVDVSGATDLKVKLLIGVDRELRFETDDYFQIYYAFDGDITSHPGVGTTFAKGNYTLLTDFRGSGSGTNPSQDADFNGVGDGSLFLPNGTFTISGPNNDLVMSDLSFNLTGTGTNLSVRIVMASDSGDETFIIDNVRVSGDVVPSSTVPTVTTTSASSITATTAVLGGNVTADGGATVSERGIVWSISDMTPEIGEVGVTKDAHIGTGTGVFSETISSLPANKTIYFNAYATNSVGTSYGTVSSFTSSQAALALTVFLEGPYGTTSMSTTLNGSALPTAQPYSSATAETSSGIPGTAVDWIEIELRTGTAANTKVGTNRAGFVLSNGSVVDKDGNTFTMPDADGTSYYIVIRHRNHLPIMSANAIAISSGAYTYNFTTSQGQSFGATPMIEVSSGVFGMPAGDADNDGDVDANDLTAWRNENGKVYSYASNGNTDLNLDGTINAADRNGFQQKNSGKSTNVPL